MNSLNPIIEANQDNFNSQVIERSKELPVMVDFWAPWCAPCRVLKPILEKLAEEYGGRFVLVTVNTDQNPRLALDYAIRSIPAVKLFRQGQVIEEFLGAQPERVIRTILERHLERASDRLRASASMARRRGNLPSAEQLLSQALEQDPENHRIHPELAQLLLDLGDYDRAEAILKKLPANEQHEAPIIALSIRLKFARIAQEAPPESVLEQAIAADPDNTRARYQLSARQILKGQFEPALENLFEILRRGDRQFGDDAA
ncbi:MAG TPA: thioredoxin, partial [Gammaproteobacteria bacterium]|nr:thioredoxin [Gammaproteobacteria bacterium]